MPRDRDIVTLDARRILDALQPVEWWSTLHPNVVIVSLDGNTAIRVNTHPAMMPEESPYETGENRYPEHLEADVTYERALQVVSDLTEGLCGDNLEYERAQLELLADLFGGPEPGLTGRIERIRADIRALAVGLWVVGDQETGERLGVFPSHDKAASFIGGLPGHQDGHYYLDGPCSDLILRDPSAED